MDLRECPSCSRHVRVSTERCPFCESALEAIASALPRVATTTRLRRAARMAFGAAVASSVSLAGACTAGTGPLDGDGGVADSGGSDSATDAATPKDTGSDKTSIPDVISENIAMPYGAPPADGRDLFV